MTTVDLPVVLRDLLAHERLHDRQPYYEIVEEAVLFWLERGGWASLATPRSGVARLGQ